MEKEIHLEPIRVVYTNSFGHPSKSDAFMRLERIVPLKGNKFYATYNSNTQEYCACAKIDDDKQAQEFGLPIKIIDGGWYATAELEGSFVEIIRKIGPTFDGLAKKFKSDSSRLPIEFYKRHTHIILYLPILKI
jgi:hypothetical protein